MHGDLPKGFLSLSLWGQAPIAHSQTCLSGLMGLEAIF